MNPGDTEQNPQKEKNTQPTSEAVNAAKIRDQVRQEIIEADTPEKKAELAAKLLQEIRDAEESAQRYEEAKAKGDDSEKKDQGNKVRKTIVRIAEVAKMSDKEEIKLPIKPKTRALLQELAERDISEGTASAIENLFKEELRGDKDIILTKEGEASDFEKKLELLKSSDSIAWNRVVEALENNPTPFEMNKNEISDKFRQGEAPKAISEESNRAVYEQQRENAFTYDRENYYGRFTHEQQEFLHNFYTPTKFKNYIESKINSPKSEEKKEDYKKRIVEIFTEQEKPIPSGQELDQLADQRWRQQVSYDIGNEFGMVLNQLLLRLQQEGANKPYDELAQEDFMRGIRATENQIRNALQTLQTTLKGLEQNPEYEKIKLYKFFDEGHYTDEREKVVDSKTGEKKTLTYPRLHPLLRPKEIGIKDYAIQLTIDMDHLLDQRNYLHDVRVVFNHPPGEKGFYGGLAGYAEKYQGTDLDEMMLLPDAPLSLEAYHLYEKYLEEDFASLDWRHRPTEFQTRLEYINTQLEQEIINQMMIEYGASVSEERIRAAVNIGTGIARGVFLTEPEKSAYADPVDAEGTGLFASYGTNDFGALNAFNPLHTALRWQSEGLLPLYYFMPFDSLTGAADRGLWDHKKMFDLSKKYFESFKKGGKYLEELKGKKLFFDELIDICNVGGVSKRRGWRMQYSLEGHMKYNENGSVNALESFKAMDAIGYEAVADFMFHNKRMGEGMLKAKEGTALGNQRKELFEYIFNRYFTEFEKTDFTSYMSKLHTLGEAKAQEKIQKEGLMPAGSFEEQAWLEASNMFLERAVIREIACRFPSKFIRIDRNRFNKEGVSRWQRIQKELGLSRDEFDRAMKDFVFAETLLRKEMSGTIKDQLAFDPTLDLHQLKNIHGVLNEETIERLLSQAKGRDKNGNTMTPERIAMVKKIYQMIKKDYLNGEFLDEKGIKAVKDYTFTFGLEDTDISLIAFRGTGPRMIARSIGDIAGMEANVVSGILELPRMLNRIATDGKHDFSALTEYLRKAQDQIQRVHGTGEDAKYVYKIAAMVIQYFKKDSVSKPLFGLFGLGKRNSIAAEYAGRSTAVWEWDSRDIDRFLIALESTHLLPRDPYRLDRPAEYENVYWLNPITKKPWKVPFAKKRKVNYEWSGRRLRENLGGLPVDMLFDSIQLVPLITLVLLYKYIKDALQENTGKKK